MQPPRRGEAWSTATISRDPGSDVEVACWHGNLLAEAMPSVSSWPTRRVIARSGSLAEGGDPFAEDLRNWMPTGRRALEEVCDRLVGPLVDSGRSLLLRPHARQVLSDVAGAADFLRRHRGERFGIALAPADLVAPSMLRTAEDLLVRTFEMLVPRLDPERDVLVLEDLSPSPDADGLPVPRPLGQGVLPWSVCGRFATSIPAGLLVLLDPATEPEATAFLAG